MVVGQQTQTKTYTNAEFWAFVEHSENQDRSFELINGELIEMPPSSPLNAHLGALMVYYLMLFVLEHDLGYVMGADGGYNLFEGQVRVPDASFVAKERFSSLPKHIQGGPDLAVEVISPSEGMRAVLDKIMLYFAAGTRLVWTIDPQARKVDVYQPTEQGFAGQTLNIDDTLTGGDVLPGFSLSLAKLFQNAPSAE